MKMVEAFEKFHGACNLCKDILVDEDDLNVYRCILL